MAIQFATTGDFLLRDGSYLNTSSAFTIVRYGRQPDDTPTGSAFRTYYNYGDGAGVDPYIYLGSDADADNIRLAYWDGASYFQTSAYTPDADIYFYSAIRYDGINLLEFIVDGAVVDDLTIDLSTISFTTKEDSIGGSWPSFASCYVGVFQSALTLGQINAQALSKTPLVTALSFTPLVTKNDLDDITVNGHDWTLTGTPLLTTPGPFSSTGVGPYTTNRLFCAPSAAEGVSVTPNAGAWVNSAWVEIEASTDAAWVQTGLVVQPDDLNADERFEIDVGTGAAASEVVVTTFRGAFASTSVASPGILPAPIPLDNIALGARVSTRLRKSNTTTTAWKIAAQFLKKPIAGDLLTTAQPQKTYPPAAADVSLTVGSTAWGDSTYTTIVASTATDIVLVGVVINILSGNSGWEVDLSVGAAASEVVIQTVRCYHTGIQFTDGPNLITFRRPIDGIVAGTRISARTRSQIIIGTRLISASLVYIEKPL